MINWGTLAAICVCCTALGGFFLYIVRGIVRDSIYRAINGYDKRMALMEQRLLDDRKDFDLLYKYTHDEWHDQINKTSDALLESFRAGRTAGMMQGQRGGDR